MGRLYFTKEHEWIEVEGDEAKIGITDYAQEQLGDIVFVELAELGKSFRQGDEVAVVESVKAASEIYAPIGGEIVAVNQKLTDDPALVNREPMRDGWFLRIKNINLVECEGLMSKDAYQAWIKAES